MERAEQSQNFVLMRMPSFGFDLCCNFKTAVADEGQILIHVEYTNYGNLFTTIDLTTGARAVLSNYLLVELFVDARRRMCRSKAC